MQSKSAVGDVKDAAGDASGNAKSAGGDINAGAKQVIGEGEGIAKSAGKQADKIANCEPSPFRTPLAQKLAVLPTDILVYLNAA